MSSFIKVSAVFVGLLLAGCAHHRDVRPGADGVNRVVFKTENKDDGYRDAMSQAEHFCKEKGLVPAVLKEQSQYTGSMDEDSYRASKTAAKVAAAAGGATYALGGKKEKNVGGIVGIGGGIADQALGKGYTFEMTFKCQ